MVTNTSLSVCIRLSSDLPAIVAMAKSSLTTIKDTRFLLAFSNRCRANHYLQSICRAGSTLGLHPEKPFRRAAIGIPNPPIFGNACYSSTSSHQLAGVLFASSCLLNHQEWLPHAIRFDSIRSSRVNSNTLISFGTSKRIRPDTFVVVYSWCSSSTNERCYTAVK